MKYLILLLGVIPFFFPCSSYALIVGDKLSIVDYVFNSYQDCGTAYDWTWYDWECQGDSVTAQWVMIAGPHNYLGCTAGVIPLFAYTQDPSYDGGASYNPPPVFCDPDPNLADPCTDLGLDPDTDCGDSENVIYDNLDTCQYHCVTCDTQYQSIKDACGSDTISVIDQSQCLFDCNCESISLIAEPSCGHLGYSTNFDSVSGCSYQCGSCDDSFRSCQNECFSYNGIFKFTCNDSEINGGNGGLGDSTCICNDDPVDSPSIASPDTDSPDPNTPTTPDPASPDDATEISWLQAIKGNTDTLINQNDTQTQHLTDIDSNTSRIVQNQDGIFQELQAVNSSSQITNGLLTSIKQGQADTDRGLSDINTTLQSMKYDGTVPSVPDFDSSLSSDYDYTENLDSSQLGSDSASSSFDSTINNSDLQTPIDASVSASSVSACIEGNVSLHGSIVPVSICFDRPWMLQGYAIMKIILIGIGYLQTALLLNRAIGS